jgi:hypothetical protein
MFLKGNHIIKLYFGGKNMKKIIVVGVILLFLGSSVPALAKTQSSLSKTIPSISALSAEDYQVYIGAGINREYEGKFGLGWHMTVMNSGDTNITGTTYNKETTLFGKVVDNGSGPFSLLPGTGFSVGSALLDFHPISFINLTVVVGNMTYSKSGYGIGPFVLLLG